MRGAQIPSLNFISNTAATCCWEGVDCLFHRHEELRRVDFNANLHKKLNMRLAFDKFSVAFPK